jgi:tripartite-type tricarboxylate transporter receptor subunit TctC
MRPMATLMSLAALSAGVASAAQAQTWPSKPIRAILAAAPGVPSDTLIRGMVEPLTRSLGQPLVVENRVGADGIIGTEACARAAADGHTLCVTASNVMIWNPVLRAKLPYDPVRDFAPVIHAAFFDSALIAHPSVKANTVQQLAQLARARPDSINWGHFGVNSTGYMYQEYLKKRLKAPFYPVPYKTQPQALNAVLSGEAHVAVYGLANAGPHLKSGKLKALAVTSAKRVDYLPKVPTFTEEGIKLPLRTWFGYHYPAGTPRPYVLRMNVEIRTLLEDPAFKEKLLDRIGLIPNPGTPEEFDAYIKTQLREVRELVSYLGITPD